MRPVKNTTRKGSLLQQVEEVSLPERKPADISSPGKAAVKQQ